MKTLIAFLLGIFLLTITAAQFPAKPKTSQPVYGEIANCDSTGIKIVIVYYEDRTEFYLDDKTLFAVYIYPSETAQFKIFVRTLNGTIHEFDSNEAAIKAIGDPCEVAQAYKPKKQGISI